MSTTVWGIWLVGSYLVGSVPFGLLIGLTRGVDIRAVGSGNVGATNAGRVLGRSWGILCFALDVCKGLAPTLGYGIYAGLSGVEPSSETGGALAALGWMAVASAAVFGHVFPVWLLFKGGKGVATGLGVLLGFWPVLTLPGLATAAVWIVTAKRTGYVSLASIAAAGSLPPLALISGLYWQRQPGEIVVYVGVSVVLALLIALRHRDNLSRLRAGTEPKAEWAQKD
jgi:glycerol-3-phosphate acyltransferase PlsY